MSIAIAKDHRSLAWECTDLAAAYAKQREQFGRPIAMFQAVKHHCANLNTQVHGGIAMTWEHDAHLFLRLATALAGLLDSDAAAAELTELAGFGFATVRTSPDAAKHRGITMMVIDMHAPGVEVRPLKMPSGNSGFNEVFFTDVFVSDDDVVGQVDAGWTVARATLGNESVSIGGGQGSSLSPPAAVLVERYDALPGRLPGGPARIGRYAARLQAMDLLNMRSAHRAVAVGVGAAEQRVRHRHGAVGQGRDDPVLPKHVVRDLVETCDPQ